MRSLAQLLIALMVTALHDTVLASLIDAEDVLVPVRMRLSEGGENDAFVHLVAAGFTVSQRVDHPRRQLSLPPLADDHDVWQTSVRASHIIEQLQQALLL